MHCLLLSVSLVLVCIVLQNLRKVANTGASVLFKEIPGTHLLLQAQV